MFSPGIYNQQRSTYVGNTLGEFMQMLPYGQQRYDESRNAFEAADAMLDNIDHLEGDREAAEMLITPFKQRITEAQQSGDYRKLYNDASKLSKQVLNDKGLKVLQSSYNNAMKQRELESTLGSKALSFTDPSQHKSITYDAEGRPQYNVYVPRVEERQDYDGRMVDIYGILKADGFPIDLREHRGDIEGFLEHGKVSGISDPKVRQYLEKAYERYISTPEGVQDFERLMRLGDDEGSGAYNDPQLAKQNIQKRLLSVGTGMVYSDTSKSFQQNPYAKLARDTAEPGYGESMVTFTPASGLTSLKDLFPKGATLNEKGELVTERDFETYFNANYTNKSDAFGDRLVGAVDAFLWGSAHMLKDWVTGKRNKAPDNPQQISAINNIRESIAAQRGISPSQVQDGLITDYIRENAGRPMPNIITNSLDIEETKRFDFLYATERIKTADGKKEILPLKQLSKHILKINGENMTAEVAFNQNDGILKDAERIRVLDKFSNDNPYGFVAMPDQTAGYTLQVTMKDGSVSHFPMQASVEAQQLAKQGNSAAISAVVENGINQARMNTMGGITTEPINIGGLNVNIVQNMADGTVKMVDAFDPTKVYSSVSTMDIINDLRIKPEDKPEIVEWKAKAASLPTQRLQSMYLLEKMKR